MGNHNLGNDDFESHYRTGMSNVTERLTEGHLERMRNVAISGASVSTANVLLLLQIPSSSISLKAALYAGVIGVPAWICAWQYIEAYLFYGKESYGHFNGPKGSGVGVLLALIGMLALLTSITALIWHLSALAAVIFLLLSLGAGILVFLHNRAVEKETKKNEPHEP